MPRQTRQAILKAFFDAGVIDSAPNSPHFDGVSIGPRDTNPA